MIIDHDRKYVFISVPKTGSISIQFSLGHGHDIPEPHLYHQSIAEALSANPECSGYFKFAFVRNPWARMLSLYKDFTLKRVHQYSGKVRHDLPLFSEFKDFHHFCAAVKDSAWWDDIFLRSQFRSLSVDGRMAMDRVGRFETLQSSFDEICSTIGVAPQLLKMNVGEYDNSDYRQHYDDGSRKAIADIFVDDVTEFGYEF